MTDPDTPNAPTPEAPTASTPPRNRQLDEAVPGDGPTPRRHEEPIASTPPRNRQLDEAVPSGAVDPDGARPAQALGGAAVARLRTALDELTAGTEPTAGAVTAIAARRTRRWMLPAVAAAAVAIVVGVSIAVVAGRGDGGAPAAPTPTGPPVPAVGSIPWYELSMPTGSVGSTPTDIGAAGLTSQVWVAPDYSRVLVAMVAATSDAATEPDDWPVVEPLPDPPVGVAWAFSADDPTALWHGIYWAPDDATAVVVTGYGFTPDELTAVLPALQIEQSAAGPRVLSAMSSLVPLPAGGRNGLYTTSYPLRVDLGDASDRDIAIASLYVSASGAAHPLGAYAPSAVTIAPATTPFGGGFRMEFPDAPAQIWWQVDDGPFWAGLSAPTAQIDDLLTRVVRVTDIPTPGPLAAPDTPMPAAPATTLSPCPTFAGAPSPHALATYAPTGGEPTTTTTTIAPCSPATIQGPGITTTSTTVDPADISTTSVPVPAVNEPAMTALMPPSFPGDGWQPPIAVGESVMLSAAKSLGTAGITVYAEEATQASGIAEELERLRDIGAFGDAVIVQVGTNGTVTEADLDRMMAAVAAVDRVVVLTAHADRPWIAPNNELIRALPSRYPNVVILDWDQIASTCDDCLAADGIHVEDRALYAGAIAEAAGLD